jgi:hypothetical protein
MAEKDTSSRGFGSMDDERQREVASEGGHAAQEKGTGHKLLRTKLEEAVRPSARQLGPQTHVRNRS